MQPTLSTCWELTLTQTHKYLKTMTYSESMWRNWDSAPLGGSSPRITWGPPGKLSEWRLEDRLDMCAYQVLRKMETLPVEQEWGEAGPLHATTHVELGFHKQEIWWECPHSINKKTWKCQQNLSICANKFHKEQGLKRTRTSTLNKLANQNYRL